MYTTHKHIFHIQKKKKLSETELQEIYQELRGISKKLKVSCKLRSKVNTQFGKLKESFLPSLSLVELSSL
jgi:hypothetical protein